MPTNPVLDDFVDERPSGAQPHVSTQFVSGADALTPLPGAELLEPEAGSERGLSIRNKLLLILLIAAVPILVLLALLWQSQSDSIDFAVEERQDLAYISTNLDAVNSVLANMTTAVAVATGQATQEDLDATIADVEANLARMQETTDRHGERLGTVEAVEDVFAKWESLKADLPTLAVPDIFARHVTLIREGITFATDKVIASSKLILDPEPASYYALDVLLNDLTPFFTDLSVMRDTSLGAMETVPVDPTVQGTISALVTALEKDIASIRALLERSFEEDAQFRTNFESKLDAAEATAVQGLELTRQVILEGNPEGVDPASYRAALVSAQDSYLGIYAQLLPEIDTLIAKRLAGLRRSQATTLLLPALLIALAVFITLRFTLSITRPLRQLVDSSTRVAQRDFSQLLQVNAKDEIGQVAQSFNKAILELRENDTSQYLEAQRNQELQTNISNYLEVIMDVAEGDLSKRGKVTDDVLGNVVDGINLMLEEFGLVLQDVQSAAASVGQGSERMLLATDAVAGGVQLQTREAQKAQADIFNVIGSVRSMAESATLSANAATRTLEASEQGRAAVEDTLNGMQNVRDDVRAVAARIRQLGRSSENISDIVRTITDVASQTNLLALSASLEAAGAGKTGERFAVVAEEIGLLAERSAAAARQVSTIIEGLQLEVGEVVSEVEAGAQDVEQSYEVAQRAGERLEEIAAISKESAQIAQQISAATNEQVRDIEHVGEVVQTMAGVSERSSENVAEGREVAQTLQTLAQELGQALKRFRLA